MTALSLPVPVLTYPHWRVNIRQDTFNPSVIPSLSECREVINATKVSLRGWDYPHLSRKEGQSGSGNNWIASWTEFMNHIEYWRFYQSAQFIHLFAVREALASDWRAQLQKAAAFHAYESRDWSKVPGYFSLLNVLYTVTEIFEFASRLAQRGVYAGSVVLTLELKGIRGFILTPDLDRAWSGTKIASEDVYSYTWTLTPADLVSNTATHSLSAAVWLFERLGWESPAIEVLRRDQTHFLSGQR
jgi:hypothetical protein